jgi:hypothetical protein
LRFGRSRGLSRAGAVIAVVISGAVVFGLYLAFVAWSSSSFPTAEKPFSDYATVVSTQFNGTELYYRVEWNSTSGLVPLYAQITSPQTDEANSPVCDLGLGSVASGQMLDLPFGIAAPKQTLASVDLAIAVGASPNSPKFTIVYHIDQINAQPGKITPSNFACTQQASSNM